MFVGIRFFVGGSIHAVWSAYFVLMAELVPASKRSLCGGVLNFGWNIGSLIMTLIAYLIRDWKHIQIAFAGLPNLHREEIFRNFLSLRFYVKSILVSPNPNRQKMRF